MEAKKLFQLQKLYFMNFATHLCPHGITLILHQPHPQDLVSDPYFFMLVVNPEVEMTLVAQKKLPNLLALIFEIQVE